jgi:hypothetical protein
MGRAALARSDVFINFPFDPPYEKLFLALIAGLVSLGLNPRSVVELTESKDRLRRLIKLIEQCPFSLHDLSRVQLSRTQGTFRVPRFNMPFELGLAIAIARNDETRQWIVMEALPHRVNQSCSDLDGYDAAIHAGTVAGVFEALLNAFSSRRGVPLSREADLFWVYRRLRLFRREELPTKIYAARPFRRLVVVATELVAARADPRRR